MNLFSNDECSAKSGTPQFKEAGPAVRLTCPERPSGANEGKSVPKDLLQLSQLVGNPNTEEHVWMNACIGAGARSLEPKHGVWYKSFSSFKTSLGATYGMLTILLNFCLGLFIAAQSAFVLKGVNLDDFIRPFSSIDGSRAFNRLVGWLMFLGFFVVQVESNQTGSYSSFCLFIGSGSCFWSRANDWIHMGDSNCSRLYSSVPGNFARRCSAT